jgi:hypothetical protein
MGYFKDEFLRHFVRKPAKRSALINRGYVLIQILQTTVIICDVLQCEMHFKTLLTRLVLIWLMLLIFRRQKRSNYQLWSWI